MNENNGSNAWQFLNREINCLKLIRRRCLHDGQRDRGSSNSFIRREQNEEAVCGNPQLLIIYTIL